MWSVGLALLPAACGAVYFFGLRAGLIIAVGILSAIFTEAACLGLRKKDITIGDGSAFLTGLLLALNLPQNIPLWMVALGSFFAIAVVKQSFGGLGHNIFNPALGGRLFLLVSYSGYMTTSWLPPRAGSLSIDSVTSATPLTALKEAHRVLIDPESAMSIKTAAASTIDKLYSSSFIWRLFTGNAGGSLGETSAVLLLIGGLYLLFRGYIKWYIPVSFLLGLGLFSWFLWLPGVTTPFSGNVPFQLFSGGALLGAFFMATDTVTTPLTKKGKLIFGGGAGIIAAIIRTYGGYPEGVMFGILLMNAAVPLIDHYIKPVRFGENRNA